jgi:hypothetical protein
LEFLLAAASHLQIPFVALLPLRMVLSETPSPRVEFAAGFRGSSTVAQKNRPARRPQVSRPANRAAGLE